MKVGTHNGTFHADELVACAIIDMLHGPISLVRTRNTALLEECDLVIDVGCKYDGIRFFDHHQSDFAASRQYDDVPYASAGLVWLHFGMDVLLDMYGSLPTELLSQAATIIDRKYIQPVDAIDTGFIRPSEQTYHFSQFISSFNFTNVNDDNNQMNQFRMVLDTIRSWLFSVITREVQNLQEQQKVQQAVDKAEDSILVLDSYLPWRDVVLPFNESCEPESKFTHVIFPSGDSWMVQAVEDLYYFPISWRGLTGKQLAKVSTEGANFCHKAGFIAGFTTREQAIKAATISLNIL
jgi:uncharacterized UPF0160 family protein